MSDPAPSDPGPPDLPQAALADELREALAPGLQLAAPIGEGGMGVVFLARDPALKRTVVVKVLSPALANDATARKRFEREAEAAASVNHPNVVGVYGVGTLPRSGTSYFVMQHVDGATLEQLFPPGTVAPEPRARRIVGEIASALAGAHARGLVHRDIKPGNVMLERETDRVVVLDFGIAAARQAPEAGDAGRSRLTQEGHSLGTPQYMSPEQALGQTVTTRSDVYSLGLVAYELLAGRLPFQETNPMALVAAHINQPPPPLASLRGDVDPALAALVDRCLRKTPEERPDSDEVARALVPGRHTVIEWPPPGTEPLRGTLWQFARALMLSALMLAGFFFSLRLPGVGDLPSLSLEATVSRTGAWVALVDTFWWLGMVVTLVFILMSGGSLARHLRRARVAGLPWRVLLDVAWDHTPDTGALLSGLGEYAQLSPAKRSRVFVLRRLRALGLAVTLAAASIGPLLWLGGRTPDLQAPASTATTGHELRGMFAPALLALTMLLGLWMAEQTLLPRRPRRRRLRLPPIRTDLLEGWLAAARLPVRPVRGTRGRLAAALASILPLAAALALTVALVMAVASAQLVLVFTRLSATYFADDARLLLRDQRRTALPWQELVSHLDAVSARTPAPPDTARARRLVAYALAGEVPHEAWIAREALPRGFAPAPGPRGLNRYDVPATLLWRPEAWLRDIAGADDAGLADWRAIARSGPLPMLWYFRPGLPGVSATFRASRDARDDLSRQMRRFQAVLWRLALRNEAIAAAAAGRGERAFALQRLRENLGVARVLMNDPALFDLTTDLAARVAATTRALGHRWNDPGLRRDGDLLGAAITTQSRTMFAARIGAALAWARVAAAAGPAILGDTSLAVAVRVALLRGAVSGYCGNPREVLFGVDQRRGQLLDSGAATLAAVARIDEITAHYHSLLDLLVHNPEAVAAQVRSPWVPVPPGPFTWFNKRGLVARFRVCADVF